jgi:hypothetical protein
MAIGVGWGPQTCDWPVLHLISLIPDSVYRIICSDQLCNIRVQAVQKADTPTLLMQPVRLVPDCQFYAQFQHMEYKTMLIYTA